MPEISYEAYEELCSEIKYRKGYIPPQEKRRLLTKLEKKFKITNSLKKKIRKLTAYHQIKKKA